MKRVVAVALVRAAGAAGCFAMAGPAAALNIIPTFDTSVTSLTSAAAIESAFNSVASLYDRALGNDVTVRVNVGWNEIGGTPLPSNAVGASQSYLYGYYSYAQIRSALTAAAAASPGGPLAQAVSYLPATAPAGSANYVVTTAQARALGLATIQSYPDGNIAFTGTAASFGFTPDTVTSHQYDFEAVAAHEIAEVLGRMSGVDNGYWRTPMDLFRYAAPGTLSYAYHTPSYFSLDGGATSLNAFNAGSGGDRGDWATNSKTTDAFDAFIGHGQKKSVSVVDLALLETIGWSGSDGGSGTATLKGTAFTLSGTVPEPSSWAMMLAGIGFAGGALRRQRVIAA